MCDLIKSINISVIATLMVTSLVTTPAYGQTHPAATSKQGSTRMEPSRDAELPYSRGQTFESLDAYLAYLRQYNGPIDLPWWREVSPGLYELQVSMPGAARERVTRAELMVRFGFTR